MTDKPGKKRDAPPPPRDGESERENERPTVSPPFDVEAFARASATHKSLVPGGAPTFDPDDPHSARVTITNEVELEQARARSAVRSEPPRAMTPSLLTMADARAKSSPGAPAAPRSLSPTSIEAAVLGAIGGSPAPEITEETIEDPVGEMRERFSLGDYTGALEMSELLLAEDPGHLEAAECGENCRSVLESMLAARLGALDRVPMVVVPRTQLRWLSMDHRAGFVLSLIDGSSSIEMILDVCGMPRLDALRILHELVQQKILAFR